MKKSIFFLFFAIVTVTCSIFPLKGKKEFKTLSPSKIQDKLEAFIEDHNWKYNGSERHPIIAANSDELKRLKSAWDSQGADHDLIAKRFALVDAAITEGISFPPEGGQHNQWYQCDICQRGLETIDAHHHKCPQCGRIYSGFPYDNVLYRQQHTRNFSRAEDAGWAWVITGEKKYSDFAAAILSGYAERYMNYPMVDAGVNDSKIDVTALKNSRYKSAGHIMSQTLDEAMLMMPATITYDLIYSSNALNVEEKKQVEVKLIRAMADCINVYKAGKSNWQTWHNAALLYAGAVIGDKQMVKQAILDDKNGFIAQMKISVTPEGMWYENSWDYHYYTLMAMTNIAEGARRLGMDLYSYDLLRKMYLIALDYVMADGSLPRFGDAVQGTPDNPFVNEKAYAVYHDERLLPTLPTSATWDMIVLGRKATKNITPIQPRSHLIPEAGHAILATDGPGKLTAALTFGPYGGFHGHFDKLSFVFFGFGQELGVDPGRAASQAYRLPIHSEWYKASTGHNVVLVDGQSQKEAGGRLLAYVSNPSYTGVSADAGPAFVNVTHHRFLLLTPTYLVVVDELRTTDGKEHSFDWLYHNKGQNVTCELPASGSMLGELPAGYAYLKDVAAFKFEKEQSFKLSFPNGSVTTQLNMLGQPGDEVFTATGLLSSVAERVPMVIVRRKGQVVHFISVLEPMETQGQTNVKGINLVSSQSLSINITRGGGEDLISFMGESLEKFTVSMKSDSLDQSVVLTTEIK